MNDPADRDSVQELSGDSSLGPVLDFLRLLWAVDHGLQSGSKRMEASLGITGPQRLVLRIVGRFPGLPAGQVAAILHVHPSTLTGILQRLEGRGLLERKSDPRDGRRALLVLTPAGRRVDALKTGTVEAAVRRALLRLPDTVDATSRLLAAVAQELGSDE